jgi:hypothetical protein
LSSVGALIVKNLELKQIWLKLQQENLEEYVNDFFQDCIREGVVLASPHILKNALLEALAEFLTIIEDELLVECGLTEAEVRDTYQVAIGRFIRDDDVKHYETRLISNIRVKCVGAGFTTIFLVAPRCD